MAAIQQLERLYRIQEGFAGDESLESTVPSTKDHLLIITFMYIYDLKPRVNLYRSYVNIHVTDAFIQSSSIV